MGVVEKENPLDLNNVPPEDGKDTSSYVGGGYKRQKKKWGGGGGGGCGGGDGKVYECRFCSLKFCKSQALGGHMNRHRQERETETLNKARRLVLSNDLSPYVPNGYHPQPARVQDHTQCRPIMCTYPYIFQQAPSNDYFVSYRTNETCNNNYTCIGTPVTTGFQNMSRNQINMPGQASKGLNS